MQVRMKTHITGNRDGVEWPAVGKVIDLPDHEATDLIAAGHAEQRRPRMPNDPSERDVPARTPRKATRKPARRETLPTPRTATQPPSQTRNV